MMTSDVRNFNVLQNDKYGRYLVANKDLESAELIFSDTPFAVGPKPDTPPLCLGCYVPVENQLCTRCRWPVCGPECETAPSHLAECALFSDARVRFQPVEDWTAPAPQLDCITPLRVLLAKEKDPGRWQQDLEPMEIHTEARRQRPSWAVDQINIADFLVDHCKLGQRFDKVLIQRVCGILEVNSVEVPSRGGFSIRALYPLLAISAHNCVPNIVHTILQNDYQVLVRAAIPIKAGDILYLCYTHALSSTLVRRDFLLESKFFRCDCARCADPTELGTHLSSLKCQKCNNGVVMAVNPLDDESPWVCMEKNCLFQTSSAAIRKMFSEAQAEIDHLDSLELGPQAIEQREATLKKYKSVFHPRNALLLGIEHTLAQLYGRVEGYGMETLPNHLLERKADLCRRVLATLDVITPGETRMRGMMLYDLHAPLVLLARRSRETAASRLLEPARCLAAAARVLVREDPHGPEGITGLIAQHTMQQLKASIESLDMQANGSN